MKVVSKSKNDVNLTTKKIAQGIMDESCKNELTQLIITNKKQFEETEILKILTLEQVTGFMYTKNDKTNSGERKWKTLSAMPKSLEKATFQFTLQIFENEQRTENNLMFGFTFEQIVQLKECLENFIQISIEQSK